MINSPATRAAETMRLLILTLGALSAALAGPNIVLCLFVVAFTTLATIRLFVLTHRKA